MVTKKKFPQLNWLFVGIAIMFFAIAVFLFLHSGLAKVDGAAPVERFGVVAGDIICGLIALIASIGAACYIRRAPDSSTQQTMLK